MKSENGEELHVLKRLELEGHEGIQLVLVLFAAVRKAVVNRVASFSAYTQLLSITPRGLAQGEAGDVLPDSGITPL